jgi:hypothetical protein
VTLIVGASSAFRIFDKIRTTVTLALITHGAGGTPADVADIYVPFVDPT